MPGTRVVVARSMVPSFSLLRFLIDSHPRCSGTRECTRPARANAHTLYSMDSALYEDSCLFLVPRSHKVPRTEEQRAQSMTLTPPKDPLAMPGAIRVTLQRTLPPVVWSPQVTEPFLRLTAGETVFYNSNILHCATYNATKRRATLHASMGDTRGGSTRARNVLQHGLEWMKDAQFRETLDETGQRMLDALIKMQNNVHGDVGYSLSG